MRTSIFMAGILAAGIAADARDSKPADVTIYVSGDDAAPSSVAQRARASVSWMYARIGVRIAWRTGEPQPGTPSGSPVTIQIRFAGEAPAGVPREALARALPFGREGAAITVMYDRIRQVSRRSSREAPILSHVLAHEIGHVLQRTNWHAPDGVMKAQWNDEDLDAMERTPLEFTSLGVEMIKDGLKLQVARSGGLSPAAQR